MASSPRCPRSWRRGVPSPTLRGPGAAGASRTRGLPRRRRLSARAGSTRSHVTWGSGLTFVSHQGQPALGRVVLLEEQYLTLELDVFALFKFTASENSDFKSRARFGVGSTPGRKRELAHPGAEDRSSATESLPLAHYPWNQVFTLQLSLACSVAG